MHISARQIIALFLLFVVLVFGVNKYTESVVNKEFENTSLALDTHIAEQELVLMKIADLTKQNNADEVTARIVVDCSASERARFEELLNKLSGTIVRAELLELDNLFFACASFFADRKAVMAARLAREVSVYKDYISLRNRIVSINDENEERVTLWERIADDELLLSGDFTKLVELQRDIIMTLMAGKSRDSIEITSTLKAVAETKNNMSVKIQQIEKTRAELTAI